MESCCIQENNTGSAPSLGDSVDACGILDQMTPAARAPTKAPPEIVRIKDVLDGPRDRRNSNASHANPSNAPTEMQTQPIHFLSGNNRGSNRKDPVMRRKQVRTLFKLSSSREVLTIIGRDQSSSSQVGDR